MSIASIVVGYAGRKLQERTTWLGIASAVAAYFGHKLPPELAEAVVTVAISFTSLALVIINERHHGPGSIPKPEAAPARADGAPLDAVPDPKSPSVSAAKAIVHLDSGESIMSHGDGTYTIVGPDGLTRHITPTGR